LAFWNYQPGKLECYGFIHQYINHSKQFVSPDFEDTHTNNIKRLWGDVKEDLKKHRVKIFF